jgi:Lipoprotein LpqB beta-propeller domain/Sporulation and spore germination
VASGRPLLWAAAVGASTVALLAGCAAAPISGVAQRLQGAGGQQQQFVEPLPPPGPQVGELGPEVVLGFLHASASFAEDPAAARAYLASPEKWHPTGTVTIVRSNLKFESQTRIPPTVSGQSGVQQIGVIGQRTATINRSGQYSYQPGAAAKFTFTLAKYGGKLLITQLPTNTGLLLTQSDFEEVFQPHNLYFYAQSAYPSGALVPDPVYVPVQGPNSALSTGVAGSLVDALINDRSSWLGGPTVTKFPAGTTLLRPVTISNQSALVDLGGKADTASQGQLDLMYAQLKATLTNSAYSPPVATGVVLAVDGKIQTNLEESVSVPSAGTAFGARAGTLYYASGGLVRQLQVQARRRTGTSVPNLAQPSSITALAANQEGGVPAPPPQLAVALRQGNGCVVHVGAPNVIKSTPHVISLSGGPCISLSWDNNGSLWAVSPAGIWVLQAGNGPVPVAAPTQLPPGARVLALRMAPDAVRAAFLVSAGGHTQLYVAAVKFGSKSKGASFGPAVPVGTAPAQAGVTAMSWYNPYFLLAASGSQVYQVPLTGGPLASVPLLSAALPAGVQSLTAAGPELAVGTAAGVIYTSTAPYISWDPISGSASEPAFPG